MIREDSVAERIAVESYSEIIRWLGDDDPTTRNLIEDILKKENVMKEKMKILIAYDGSDCADGALDGLRRAGLPREAEAVVLSVVDAWPAPPPSSHEVVEAAFAEREIKAGIQRAPAADWEAHARNALEEAHALAERARERLKAHFPAWEVRAEGGDGSPAKVVLKAAEEWRADLIVVGSHGRSAAGRFFFVGVSQKVASEAVCSVRVARGRNQINTGPVRIVIGYDGSPGAEAAVRAVAARAWPQRSEARVIAAHDPLVKMVAGYLIPRVGGRVEAEGRTPGKMSGENEGLRAWEIVEAAAEKLRAAGLAAEGLVKKGDAKHVLVAEADDWAADCIFVGARGITGLERFLLGSVSTAVVTHAHCSVEVVRTP